jgi:hypothetical protein
MAVRLIFTDKWNSFWHVVFGVLAVRLWWIIPVFLVYQFILKYDENSIIDTAEFFTGYLFELLVNSIIYSKGKNLNSESPKPEVPPLPQ